MSNDAKPFELKERTPDDQIRKLQEFLSRYITANAKLEAAMIAVLKKWRTLSADQDVFLLGEELGEMSSALVVARDLVDFTKVLSHDAPLPGIIGQGVVDGLDVIIGRLKFILANKSKDDLEFAPIDDSIRKLIEDLEYIESTVTKSVYEDRRRRIGPHYAYAALFDGREIAVLPMLMGEGAIMIGRVGGEDWNSEYLYTHWTEALEYFSEWALNGYVGEPSGWRRAATVEGVRRRRLSETIDRTGLEYR